MNSAKSSYYCSSFIQVANQLFIGSLQGGCSKFLEGEVQLSLRLHQKVLNVPHGIFVQTLHPVLSDEVGECNVELQLSYSTTCAIQCVIVFVIL